MATLMVADTAATNDLKSCGTASLHDWLAGQWAVLFSNPEHFAPHPSTPQGFITLLADDFVACRVKPITVARCGHVTASWLDYAGADNTVVLLDTSRNEQVVDLSERTLASTVTHMQSPFVIVIDAHARCRSTMTYRHQTGARSRTIGDVLSVVQVLRAGPRPTHRERYGRVA